MKATLPILVGLALIAPWALADDSKRLIRSAGSGRWSAADTWEGGKVPDTGAKVQIRLGHTVTYDVSSDHVIRSIHVAGTLTFARDRDTRLDVGLIKIQPGDDASEDGFNCDAHPTVPSADAPRPALEVGTPDHPIPAGRTALIRLVPVDGLNRETCPAIVCCGGRMDLHGAPMSRTWVKLGATAKPDDTEVRLAESVTGWRPGDRIIVTSTSSRERINTRASLRPGKSPVPGLTEERIIKSIDGDRIALTEALENRHRGTGDYRGELANLSRNVVIESADLMSRGHTMYHRHSAGSISYAEFRHLGKEGVLGKYPIHYHLCGDTMRGSSVIGASIWDSGNRWVTIHGTQYLVVRDCVGYQSVGHGYFLEDGTEVFNVLDRNLAVQAFIGKPLPQQALPFDFNDGAGFWWANSLNTFTRNVAAECDRWGFRFEAVPTKDFDLCLPVRQPDGTTQKVDIRTLPFVRFDGNEAHDHLVGINLGGASGDFFHGGVDGVVPHLGQPFLLQNTRLWNAQWAFQPYTRYAVDNLDIADSIYGVFLPAYNVETPRVLQRPAPGSDEEPDFGRLTFNRVLFPVFLPAAGRKYTGEPFDLMEFAGDTLPPTTVITGVCRTKDGLVVRGTTAEDGRVRAVVVNNKQATATRANFAEWQVTLPAADGDVTLKAFAVDNAANIEPTPHTCRVRVPKEDGAGVAFLVSPADRPTTSPVAAKSPPKAAGPVPDVRALQGKWEVISQQRAGRPLERPKNARFVFDGDTVALVIGKGAKPNGDLKKPLVGPDGKPFKGSTKILAANKGLPMRSKIDASVSPPRIDLSGPKKTMTYGIFRLDGDELTICLGRMQPLPEYEKATGLKSDGTSRPTEFSPAAGTLIVLRRVKE